MGPVEGGGGVDAFEFIDEGSDPGIAGFGVGEIVDPARGFEGIHLSPSAGDLAEGTFAGGIVAEVGSPGGGGFDVVPAPG